MTIKDDFQSVLHTLESLICLRKKSQKVKILQLVTSSELSASCQPPLWMRGFLLCSF